MKTASGSCAREAHPVSRHVWVAWIAVAFGPVGCEPAPRPSADVTAHDTLTAELLAEIGEVDGSADYLFGRIVDVAVDREGVTYVADDIGSTVRAYDLAGTYLGTVGSEGEGPGEFRYLIGLDIDPGGRVCVRGAYRMSVFVPSSQSAFADSLVRTVALQGIRADRGVRTRAGASRYYGPGYVWEEMLTRGYYYEVYDTSGAITDTILVPPFPDPESTRRANYLVSAEGGRNVDGIARTPFEARPSWDITDEGHVLMSAGDRYEIVETAPGGDTLRVISRPFLATRIPTDEWRDSAAAFEARLDSVPVPMGQVRGMSAMARRRELPSTAPAVVSLQAGDEGELWVRRWPRPDHDETLFDVLDEDGTPLRTVRLPVAVRTMPRPWVEGDVMAGVTSDPETGVETVSLFRRPAA